MPSLIKSKHIAPLIQNTIRFMILILNKQFVGRNLRCLCDLHENATHVIVFEPIDKKYL